jgi:hypothetical protein
MTLLPKSFGDLQGIDLQIFPKSGFVPGLMNLAVVSAAERDGELVADLATERLRLAKAQVMRVSWLAAADQAGLGGNKSQMSLVAETFWLAEGEDAFVDLLRSGLCCSERCFGALCELVHQGTSTLAGS